MGEVGSAVEGLDFVPKGKEGLPGFGIAGVSGEAVAVAGPITLVNVAGDDVGVDAFLEGFFVRDRLESPAHGVVGEKEGGVSADGEEDVAVAGFEKAGFGAMDEGFGASVAFEQKRLGEGDGEFATRGVGIAEEGGVESGLDHDVCSPEGPRTVMMSCLEMKPWRRRKSPRVTWPAWTCWRSWSRAWRRL